MGVRVPPTAPIFQKYLLKFLGLFYRGGSSCHTSRIQFVRSGTYYYNRRVPIHAVNSYGHFIRQVLSKDPLKAEALSKRLSNVLEGAWSATTNAPPVNVFTIIKGFHPRRVALSEIAVEYLALKQIDQTPPRVALSTFLSSSW